MENTFKIAWLVSFFLVLSWFLFESVAAEDLTSNLVIHGPLASAVEYVNSEAYLSRFEGVSAESRDAVKNNRLEILTADALWSESNQDEILAFSVSPRNDSGEVQGVHYIIPNSLILQRFAGDDNTVTGDSSRYHIVGSGTMPYVVAVKVQNFQINSINVASGFLYPSDDELHLAINYSDELLKNHKTSSSVSFVIGDHKWKMVPTGPNTYQIYVNGTSQMIFDVVKPISY
jgi:hypothetical protein